MRLKFDARARAILRRVPAVSVYSLAELVLLAALAIQCARLTWAIATPVSPVGDWRPAEPGLAGSPADILRGFDPFFRISGTQEPAAVTSLNVKLFGTRIDEAMGRGSAIIAGADGIQKSVSVGEEIAPGVVLRAVAFDHVTIERGGTREDLFLDQSGRPPEPSGPAPAPAPAQAAAGPVPAPPAEPVTVARLQADIGFVPRIEGGRLNGLVVRAQGAGAGFRAAGLRAGDIVTAIGGRPVTGPDDFARLSRDLANGGILSMTVERGDETVQLAARVAPR